MKIQKLFYGLLIGIMFFWSCSSDKSNGGVDLIIGKWRAIEKLESDQTVELPVCLPHIYTEYKADNRVTGDKILSNNFPVECNSIVFDFNVVWENLGNSSYRIGYSNEEGTIYVMYKDGVNLVQELPDGITTFIYEPY